MTNYVVFGLPGSGKGTLSQFLQQHSDVVQVCSGDLLRNEAKSNKEIQMRLNQGEPIEEWFVTQLVISRLEKLCLERKRFILDGFPQSWKQYEALKRLLVKYPDLRVQNIIIDVEKKTALKRMASRFSCVNCAKIFNLETRPPKEKGKCDDCQGLLKQRQVDVGQHASERIEAYEKTTRNVIEYYRNLSDTCVFDGNRSLQVCLKDYATCFKTL